MNALQHQLNRLRTAFLPGEPYDFRDNMVIHPYRMVYFYIPKVACTTLKETFFRLTEGAHASDTIHDISHRWESIRKTEAGRKYKTYLKFAIVRNPWDRLYAVFKEKIKTDPNINHKFVKNGVERCLLSYGELFYAGMPFHEFVEVICKIPDEEANEHFRSQHTFLTDRKGKLIVDYVGRFENLAEDVISICQRQQVPIQDIPHLNKNQARTSSAFQDAYDAELVDKVQGRYQRDVELFEYSFAKETDFS